MSVGLSPVGNDAPFFLSTGVAASGAKLFIYNAGSTTKATSYQDSGGLTPNANPVLLNSSGYPASGGSLVEIWLTTGANYKFVLAPSTDTDPPGSAYWTRDNVPVMNDVVTVINEWVGGPTPTYVSATQFTLVGDQTNNFHAGRRVKATVTAGTSYGTITASAFTTLTTVTVDTRGSNALDSGLSAVSYGLLRSDNFTQSIGNDVAKRQSSDIASASTVNLDAAGGDLVDVTGTVTITAITLSQGRERTVRFTGVLTLTNGASLVLRNGVTRITQAGEMTIFRGYASGVVREVVQGTAKQPTRQSLTSGSGATYTTPAGATRIFVRMIGGGGGGGGTGTAGSPSSGGTGGNTTFSTFTASGGAGGTIGNASSAGVGGAGGAAAGGSFNMPGGSGSTSAGLLNTNATGGAGGVPTLGGAAGSSAYPNTILTPATNSGGGGSGISGNANVYGAGGGGAGGYVEAIVLAPAATYTYTVGTAGTAGAAGTNGGAGSAGAAGVIIVDEFYD
jgi:hypothetical protein